MGTRSDIIVQRSTGEFARIYCHWDGYLSNNGKLLFTHYNSQELAESLVALGDLSSLGEVIGEKHDFDFGMNLAYTKKDSPDEAEYNRLRKMCNAYGRDRGEDGVAAVISPMLAEAIGDDTNEYTYVWSLGRNGVPAHWSLYTDGRLIPLDTYAAKEWEEEEAA